MNKQTKNPILSILEWKKNPSAAWDRASWGGFYVILLLCALYRLNTNGLWITRLDSRLRRYVWFAPHAFCLTLDIPPGLRAPLCAQHSRLLHGAVSCPGMGSWSEEAAALKPWAKRIMSFSGRFCITPLAILVRVFHRKVPRDRNGCVSNPLFLVQPKHHPMGRGLPRLSVLKGFTLFLSLWDCAKPGETSAYLGTSTHPNTSIYPNR